MTGELGVPAVGGGVSVRERGASSFVRAALGARLLERGEVDVGAAVSDSRCADVLPRDAGTLAGCPLDAGALARIALEADVRAADSLSADVFARDSVSACFAEPGGAPGAFTRPCAAPPSRSETGLLPNGALDLSTLPDGNGAVKRDAPGDGAIVAGATFATGAVIAGGRFGIVGDAGCGAGFASERETVGTGCGAGFASERETTDAGFDGGAETGRSAPSLTASLKGDPRPNATPIGNRAGVVRNVPDCARVLDDRPTASEPELDAPAPEALPSEAPKVGRPAPEVTVLRMPTLEPRAGAAGGCVTCAAGGGSGL